MLQECVAAYTTRLMPSLARISLWRSLIRRGRADRAVLLDSMTFIEHIRMLRRYTMAKQRAPLSTWRLDGETPRIQDRVLNPPRCRCRHRCRPFDTAQNLPLISTDLRPHCEFIPSRCQCSGRCKCARDMKLWCADVPPRKPKNARVKRALEKREPQVEEGDKTAIFVRGNSTSERVRTAMQDLVSRCAS